MRTITNIPSELKATRLALGFRTRRQLAEALGVSTRAVASWEQGWRPIPAWVWKFLDCLSGPGAQAPDRPQNEGAGSNNKK